MITPDQERSERARHALVVVKRRREAAARSRRRCPHRLLISQDCQPCRDLMAHLIDSSAARWGVTIPVPPLT